MTGELNGGYSPRQMSFAPGVAHFGMKSLRVILAGGPADIFNSFRTRIQ